MRCFRYIVGRGLAPAVLFDVYLMNRPSGTPVPTRHAIIHYLFFIIHFFSRVVEDVDPYDTIPKNMAPCGGSCRRQATEGVPCNIVLLLLRFEKVSFILNDTPSVTASRATSLEDGGIFLGTPKYYGVTVGTVPYGRARFNLNAKKAFYST